MSFSATAVVGEVPQGAATLKNWDYFEGILLSIGFSTMASVSVEGSAVLVAPGVALVAAHVLISHFGPMADGIEAGWCFGIARHGLVVWSIRRVTFVPDSDLAIIELSLASSFPPDNLFHQSRITTRTPAIGEEVIMCGFVASATLFARTGSGFVVGGQVWLCRGAVTEHYPNGRDCAMLPWPAYAVEVLARGGMSGGPVYDLAGNLIGLTCSSMDFGADKGISYVSRLWPALTMRFPYDLLFDLGKPSVSLLEMERIMCAIEKPDAVKLENTENGTLTTYNEWQS